MDYFSTRLSGASLAYFNGLADRSISVGELHSVLVKEVVDERQRVASLEEEHTLHSEAAYRQIAASVEKELAKHRERLFFFEEAMYGVASLVNASEGVTGERCDCGEEGCYCWY